MKAIVTGMCGLVFFYAGVYMWKINKKIFAILLYLIFALFCYVAAYNAGMGKDSIYIAIALIFVDNSKPKMSYELTFWKYSFNKSLCLK